MKTLLVLLSLCLSSNLVIAQEHSDYYRICGKYQRMDESWSQYYKLSGYYMTGGEINREFGINKYEENQDYFVIRWRKGDPTVFKSIPAKLSSTKFTKIRDYTNRLWIIKRDWSNCK